MISRMEEEAYHLSRNKNPLKRGQRMKMKDKKVTTTKDKTNDVFLKL